MKLFEPSVSLLAKLAKGPRFIHYMLKMRTVNLSIRSTITHFARQTTPSSPWVHPDVIKTSAMVAEAHGAALFENAKECEVELSELERTETLVHILHPFLKDIGLRCTSYTGPADVSGLCVVLLRLQHSCPNIQWMLLDLPIPDDASTVLSHIPPAITAIKNLDVLFLPPSMFTPALWTALQDTAITRLEHTAPFPITTTALPTALPSSLRVLELSLGHRSLSKLFDLGPGSLRTLHIIIPDAAHDVQLSTLFQNVASLAPYLCSLSVALMGNATLPAPVWYQPLQTLKHLTSLNLYLDGMTAVGDRHYQSLVEACPHLLDLSCRPIHPEHLSSQATLQTLATIANHCRSIQTISISLDCTSYPANPAAWTSFSNSVRSLDMVYSRISNSARVASVMCHLFRGIDVSITSTNPDFVGHPALHSIDRDVREVSQTLWREVNSTLGHFYAASMSRQAHIACDREVKRLRIENEELRAKVSRLDLSASCGGGERTGAVSQWLADENDVESTVASVGAK